MKKILQITTLLLIVLIASVPVQAQEFDILAPEMDPAGFAATDPAVPLDSLMQQMQAALSKYTNQIAILQEEVDRQQLVQDELNEARSVESERKIEYADKLRRLQNLYKEREAELQTAKEALQEKEILLAESQFIQESFQEVQEALTAAQAENAELAAQVRPGSPHLAQEKELRLAAEASRDALADRVREMEEALVQMQASASPARQRSYRTGYANDRVALLEAELKKLKEQRQQEAWEKTVLQESLTRLRKDVESEMRPIPAGAQSYRNILGAAPVDSLSPRKPRRSSRPAPTTPPALAEKAFVSVSPVQQVALANKKLRAGRVNDAQRIFLDVLETTPEQPGARLGLASCYYALRDFASAKKLIDELMYDEPRNAHALGLRGLIAYNDGDLVTASGALSLSLEINKSDPQLYNYYGMVLFAQADIPRAAAAFERSIALDPGRPEAQMNLTLLLCSTEPIDLLKARRHYETAIRLGAASNARIEKVLYEQ